jgi:hypothetical protein
MTSEGTGNNSLSLFVMWIVVTVIHIVNLYIIIRLLNDVCQEMVAVFTLSLDLPEVAVIFI